MKRDIPLLVDSDCLLLLDGWEEARGNGFNV